jgi:hypothetical protein
MLTLSAIESLTVIEGSYGGGAMDGARTELMDRINRKSYSMKIEGSDMYTDVGKITLMKKNDGFFILAIAHSDNKFVDFFKIE